MRKAPVYVYVLLRHLFPTLPEKDEFHSRSFSSVHNLVYLYGGILPTTRIYQSKAARLRRQGLGDDRTKLEAWK